MNIVTRVEIDRRRAVGAQIQSEAWQLRHSRTVDEIGAGALIVDGRSGVNEERVHGVGHADRPRRVIVAENNGPVQFQRGFDRGVSAVVGVEQRDGGDRQKALLNAAIIGVGGERHVGVGAADAIRLVLAADRQRAPPLGSARGGARSDEKEQ